MPLYEYKCVKCGHRMEVLLDVDEPEPESCPECKGKLKRLLGVPGLIFKGSGFYATDYARKNSVSSRPNGGKTSDGSKDTEKHEKSADASNLGASAEKSEPVAAKA
ncbi:MAG: zinc ribbon domain-containing protein [Candidatus Coatesbacteria bacterium]|nr:zinc ribbon domain-containing protein [Candidatus Coatesbacteria bacterium]